MNHLTGIAVQFHQINIQPTLIGGGPDSPAITHDKNKYRSTFLDCDVSIIDGDLHIKVYNKTDDFPFPVKRYCSATSMVHSSLGYKVLYGEMHRFASICTDRIDFINVVRQTVEIFLRNGYTKQKIIFKIAKFCVRNKQYTNKFGIHNENELKFALEILT